jgi:predicted nucleotidyltransferase
MLPRRQQRYAEEVAGRLAGVLGEDLPGVYVVGSGALGDWIPGRSDIDVMAICEQPLTQADRDALGGRLRHAVLPCPARALELVVYTREAVRAPRLGVRFELNLNTGEGIEDHVTSDPGGEAAHWFVLDLAAAREHARPLKGPPANSLIGAVPEPELAEAMRASLRWHAEHEAAGANAVLNACRSWRRIECGDWTTKGDAGRWAIERGADLGLVRDALRLHEGARGELDAAAAAAFLAGVSARLATP